MIEMNMVGSSSDSYKESDDRDIAKPKYQNFFSATLWMCRIMDVLCIGESSHRSSRAEPPGGTASRMIKAS